MDSPDSNTCGRPFSPLVRGLKALFRAFQNMSMYAPGHPMVWEAVEQAAQSFGDALAGRKKLVITVTQDHLICDFEKISESSNELRDLALLLHDLDIAAVELHPGLTVDQLEMFLQTLAQARKQKLGGEKLLEAFAAYSIDKIRLYSIDYRTLNFAAGTDEGRDNKLSSEDIWAQMARLLTDTAAIPTYGALQHLANEIASQIYRYEGVGVQVLREQMHQVVQSMHSRPAEQHDMIRTRMATFVAGLNDNLRQDLLRITSRQQDNTLSLLTELAAELPVEDLTAALSGVALKGHRSPEEMLRLVKKLIDICRRQPRDASKLHDILQRWGIYPEMLKADTQDLRGALFELFQHRSQTDFNPEDYKPQLDACSEAKPALAFLNSAARYEDPFNRDKVRSHAARIAAQLLGKQDEDQYHSSLFAYVDTATDLLLELGNIKTVRQAAAAAQRHRLLKTNSDDTRLAAQGYLDNLKKPRRIDAIINSAYGKGQLAPEALDLLGKVGGPALCVVLDFRARQGWPALEPIFPIIRRLKNRETVTFLEKLLDHAQFKVRREALNTLWEIDDRPESVERYLRLALHDADCRIGFAAIQRLAQWDTMQSLELLQAYIEGKLSRRLPPLYHCRRAAEVLTDRGEAGIKRLCRVLRFLSTSPLKARRARLIADILQPQADAVEVGKALKSWRFSPARLACIFLMMGRSLQRRFKSDRSRR